MAAAAASAAARRHRFNVLVGLQCLSVDLKTPSFRLVPTTKCSLRDCLLMGPFPKSTVRTRSGPSQLARRAYPAKIRFHTGKQFQQQNDAPWTVIFKGTALGVKDALQAMVNFLFQRVKAKVFDHFFKMVMTLISGWVVYRLLPLCGMEVEDEEMMKSKAGPLLKVVRNLLRALFEKRKAIDTLKQEVHAISDSVIEKEKRLKKVEETLEKVCSDEKVILKELDNLTKALEARKGDKNVCRGTPPGGDATD